MENCPSEILQYIYGYLDFDDLANLRLVSSLLSKTAVHGLVSKVTFHCSPDSFDRLNAFADHEAFRQQVTKLVFETNMLAFLSCEHAYAAHYHLEHHRAEQPAPPEEGDSARAWRLWRRNQAKFEQGIKDRYDHYKELYDAQQDLISSDAYRAVVAYAISRFPRLTAITIYNAGKCKHLLSKRFLSVYGKDCSIPINSDTTETKVQLQLMLLTEEAKASKIENLSANAISHQFFSRGFQPQNQVVDAFRNLKHIDLHFRLESNDRAGQPIHASHCFFGLKDGGLRNALAAAQHLEKLNISFASCLCQVYCTDLKFIVGDTVWPSLKSLSLDSLVVNGDDLITKLKQQPALIELDLGFIKSRDQLWIEVLDKMRKELKVKDFFPFGVLEDPEEQYFMDWVDRHTGMHPGGEETLASAISYYVVWTKNIGDDDPEAFNPLLSWEDYMPVDELEELYSSPLPWEASGTTTDEDSWDYSDDDYPFLHSDHHFDLDDEMDVDDSDTEM